MVAGPQTVHAANITVHTLEDSFVANANCSLREAISSANQNPAFDTCTAGDVGADVINDAVPGTITLQLAGKNEENDATGDLDILEGLTINGKGAVPGAAPGSGTTINGNSVDRVFDVKPSALLILNDLQVREGNPSSGGSNGGGVFAAGGTPFSATDVLVFSNTARGQAAPNNGGSGGGLFLDFNTVVSMNRVSFIQNSASSVSPVDARGGAIFNDGFADPVTNVQFDGNTASASGGPGARGAARFNDETMRISHATITNNTFTGPGAPTGGGVYKNSPSSRSPTPSSPSTM